MRQGYCMGKNHTGCTYINPDEFEGNLNILRKFLHKFGKQTNQGEVVFEFAGRFFRIREYD